MHPPRRNGASERPKIVDRFADWLLAHCPLTSLTLLTFLVGSTFDIPRPWQVFVAVGATDLMINLIRLRRRAKQAAHVGESPMRRRATA